MALIEGIAEFIAGLKFDDLGASTVDQAKLHIFDSLAALLAGASTAEAQSSADLVRDALLSGRGQGVSVPGFDFSAPLPLALLLTCSSVRMTETDDIDIASCTTIGSVVVPASLLLAFDRGAAADSLIEGAAAGYEVISRLGAAVKGAEIIYRGIWTTYLCGAAGVAAAGSKILGLGAEATANALAISLSLSTGLSGRVKTGLSSRWLTLGCAAQNGLIACLAAARGFAGDKTLLDGPFASAHSLELSRGVLLDGLGRVFRIGKVDVKPYCSARQAISSIEAFLWLMREHKIVPEAIEEVEVVVPTQYSRMIDVAGFPESRLESITSIRYQLALAAFYEDDLFDMERKTLRDEQRVRTFMKKVRISTDEGFTALYPEKWPGRIKLRASGRRVEHEVLSPRGDADHPLSWDEAEQKAKRLSRPFFGEERIAKLRRLVEGIHRKEKTDELLSFLHRG